MATMKAYRVDVEYQDDGGAVLTDAETVYATTEAQAARQITREYKRSGYTILSMTIEVERETDTMTNYLSQFGGIEDDDDNANEDD